MRLPGAALSRERLEEDEQALETWLDMLAPLGRDRQLDLCILAGMPRAVTRRALHRWLLAQRQPTDLSRQGFEILLAAVERGRSRLASALGRKGLCGDQAGPVVLLKEDSPIPNFMLISTLWGV